MALINQPTAAPTNKVTASVLGGAAATVVCVIVQMITGVEFPTGFEAAVAVLFGFIAGYVTKEEA